MFSVSLSSADCVISAFAWKFQDSSGGCLVKIFSFSRINLLLFWIKFKYGWRLYWRWKYSTVGAGSVVWWKESGKSQRWYVTDSQTRYLLEKYRENEKLVGPNKKFKTKEKLRLFLTELLNAIDAAFTMKQVSVSITN